ncbi:hypothetical protein R75461_01155 [Paraburkholderia nemoris]|uniref:hypothetical protein n=1 Tax=Paraburkholderia nemoris TaxID=2793076 RepID=UPI001B2A1949|nr:hypothetical protein [Paraburkholderia nemoris]CAE6713168.1 hypothetical protein R75461_01155 [Paraburkholderia nemoris]
MLIAIDPGIKGALAFFNPHGCMGVHDMPVRTKPGTSKIRNEVDPKALQAILRRNVPPDEKGLVVMESLNAFMGSGEERHGSMASQASLAATKAVICTVCELSGFDMAFVSPKAWQSFFGIKATRTETTKQQSLRLARSLFGMEYCPLQKHDGRADALLIGRYGQRHLV